MNPNPGAALGYNGPLNKFSNLQAQTALVGTPPPDELIKATNLCLRAWANFSQAIIDCDEGKITMAKREAYFRVAIRIDGLVNRLAAAWHHDFMLVIMGIE